MKNVIEKYLNTQKIKVVETYDFENKKVKYSEKIKGGKLISLKATRKLSESGCLCLDIKS